ncbi:MAG: 5-histidylcysteine sulfoxide synthase [Arcobacter sp.]|nr:5-histidylcysteine sulfoxide synthase [Arcobacter sp.]
MKPESNLSITRNLSLRGDNIESKRAEIREYFLKTYSTFEELFLMFASETTFYEQPEKLRHPLIFYFGHTAIFYINKLTLAGYLTKRINPKFETMFAVGVDEMSWDDLNQDNYDWPTVAVAKNYRNKAKEIILDFIDNVNFTLPITWENPMWAIMMGIEHERIHLETSSVLHRQLNFIHIKPNPNFIDCDIFGDYPKNELINVSGKEVRLGKKIEDDFYGWDNEYGEASYFLDDFKASKYLVSNGEFLEFVQAGGYQNDTFWDDEGLRWRNYTKAVNPIFWINDGGAFLLRTIQNQIELPLSWPVEVNCLEAFAFCKWKSLRENRNISLPTEADWYKIHQESGLKDEPYWNKNEKAPANINLEHFASPCPVNKFAHGKFYDVIGNVWQWTKTTMDGFDGFKTHPLYDDFSFPTFDTRHNMIKGGSFISTGNEVLLNSRYAFRRHFFQHAGFRYVETTS